MTQKNFVASFGYAQYLEIHSLNTSNFGKVMLSKFMDETLADSAERAKQLIIDNSLPSDTQTADVPTCFDGSWSMHGWVAQKGLVAAIAENTSQVIDLIFKSNY